MVPADLGERPDERELGHVGAAAVAVVVVVPPFAALVLVPANDNYSQAGSHITESLGTYLVTATCLTLDFIEFNSRVPPVCPFSMLSA